MTNIKLFRYKENYYAQEIQDIILKKEKYLQNIIEQNPKKFKEKFLHRLIEENLETFLGIQRLGGEYKTGKKYRVRTDTIGVDENANPVVVEYKRNTITRNVRLDTIGIDENACPVIIEYKRGATSRNVTQVLSYLTSLNSFRSEFESFVSKKLLDQNTSVTINWSRPRLLCIAREYTYHTENAAPTINRLAGYKLIELIRYRRFGDDLLMLEWINESQSVDDYS